ncbi:MAG: flagellar hook-associated protein FlgK, partial [Burkholderiales bacterium]
MGSLISIGTKALAASSAALQTTGHNIANANTKGYSKQSVELETAGGRYTGLGFFGDGVNVTNIKRDHDEFLTREASITTSVTASDEARLKQLEQMEKIFGLGEAGIGDAAGKFFNAFADVVSKPQDLTARQVVLSRAGDLVTRFRTSAERLDSLQAGVSQDIKVSIAAVNSLTSEIASLNEKIARMESTGKAPNDLLDQRDLSLSKLSELIQITTLKASDGTLGVFMGGGQQLVLGQRATLLSAVPNVYDPAKVQVAINDSAGVRPLENYLFTGGSVAGLLRFQSTDITDARNLIGQMATAISDRMNQQQALGLDLGAASSGAPIFSMTSGRVLPNIQNALAGGVPVASYLDPGGNRVSSVSFSVADATQLRASDYELEVTGASAGPYQLRRLVDNVVRSVYSGDTIDGFKLQIQPTALPASGDKFLIQPVGQGSSTLTLAMS